MAAVNCVGDVIQGGRIIAGARSDDGINFADSEAIILQEYRDSTDFFSRLPVGGRNVDQSESNTVLGCLITNARVDKAGATRLASQGQNGIARCIRPAHSIFDGDTVFALCTGKVEAAPDAVGILCAMAMEAAIIDGVKSAQSLGGYPAAADLVPQT